MSFFEFPHTRTYDTDLGWLIKDYKTLDELIAAIKSWIQETQPTIDDFKALIDAIKNGILPEPLAEGIYKWLQENALELIGSLATMVWFGITDDGYFVAYIPESWDDIVFGTTGLDTIIPGYEYGRLVLSMEIGG